MFSLAFKIAAETDSEWSKLIAKASNSPYSHVEGWLSGDKNKALCFSSREPIGAGFQEIDLTQKCWDIIEFKLSTQEEFAIVCFCWGANGKEYDLLGLLGYKQGTGWHDDHDVFCSEFWAACLTQCIGLPLPKEPWMTSPGDLYTLVKGIK